MCLNGLDVSGINLQKGPDGSQHLRVVDGLVFVNQPIPRSSGRGKRACKLGREEPELGHLEKSAVIVLWNVTSKFGDHVGVDVKGRLDGFLEKACAAPALSWRSRWRGLAVFSSSGIPAPSASFNPWRLAGTAILRSFAMPNSGRTKEKEKLEIRQRLRKISETLADGLGSKNCFHAATLSERSHGVNFRKPLLSFLLDTPRSCLYLATRISIRPVSWGGLRSAAPS